jgi:hypothetical protein
LIVSSIKGRVRLRSDRFKNPSLSLEDAKSCPGVTRVVHTPATGSVLINYDPEVLGPEKAREMLAGLDPSTLEGRGEAVRDAKDRESPFAKGFGLFGRVLGDSPRNDAVGLTFTLLSLVVSGFMGTKKFHVMLGLFFVELVVKHVWRYRGRLTPPKDSVLGDFLRPGHRKGGKTPVRGGGDPPQELA